jgi:hypothetical protein
MSKPALPDAESRRSTPAAIALAIMLLACALILTALVVLAQGAVAAEPDRTVRQQTEQQSNDVPAEHTTVAGHFTLDAAATADEQALAAQIEASSVGGGFVSGTELHVVIEVRRERISG